MIFKNIGIASDHGGFHLKSEILSHFKAFKDYGTKDETSVDYSDYANNLCLDMEKSIDCGILICKTGIGMSIAANRYSNIRAALCYSDKFCKLTREHNNSNILCLSSDIQIADTISIIKTFIETPFSNELRHIRRLAKIKK